MSLINNLLKDLERREGKDTPLLPLLNNSHEKSSLITQKNIFLITSVIFLSMLFIAWLTIPKKKLTTTTTSRVVQQSFTSNPANIANAEDSQWVAPVTVTGITVEVKDNITELSFLLNHPALYHVVSDNINNQLGIILDNAQIQSELPPLQYLHTAIQNITTNKTEGDTRFNLSFYPGAVIKYINLNNDEKSPALVVAIEYQGNALPPVEAPKLVKMTAMQTLLKQQYQTALSSAESGHYQTAITNLKSLLKVDPEYRDARMSLAALLMDQGNQFDAKQVVDAGLDFDPGYVPFIELKARLLVSSGKHKEALTLLQRVSPSLTENPEYHAFVAALYERNNNDLLAMKIYKELLAMRPNNGSWWLGLGISLEKLHEDTAAVDAFSKALASGNLNAESISYIQTHMQNLQRTIA